MVKKKITIRAKGKGKVHNVGYRLFLFEQADSLFIEEFDARNVIIDDLETLIVLVAGEDSQVTEFIDFVNNPLNRPEEAIVDNIIVENWEGRVREIDKFRQSFNTVQLGKIVKTGLLMIGKQEETIGEIRNLRDDLKLHFDKRFEILEKDVFLIKKKMCIA
jgi:acylphosphatase